MTLSGPAAALAEQLEELNGKGRWWSHEALSEHDRQVAEKAWDEGHLPMHDLYYATDVCEHVNPHALSDDAVPGGAS